MEEGYLHSNSSLKRSSKCSPARMENGNAFLHCSITPSSKHLFQGIMRPDFLWCASFTVSHLLHHFLYSVCLIPRLTNKIRMHQGCAYHVSILPVGPLKSSGFPLVYTRLWVYSMPEVGSQSVFALPETAFPQSAVRTAKKSRLQIPAAST